MVLKAFRETKGLENIVVKVLDAFRELSGGVG